MAVNVLFVDMLGAADHREQPYFGDAYQQLDFADNEVTVLP
jgi:hypothetical protein